MRSALVISPFATAPLDAARRRRVHQTTRLLADNGFRVTLLLLACEEGWRVRHQEADFARLREQWGEVICVYGDAKIGLPPRNGARHQLDEWWDFTLEQTLRNILSRRFFDLCLVHQAWLNRAFDLIDGSTAKILDIQEIRWRRERREAAGVTPAGWLPDEATELFALERADIIVTALEADAADLARRTSQKIVNLPFYDAALEAETRAASASRYGDPDKVSFGFVGNGDAADASNLDAVLAALQEVAGTTPPPVEIVIGGEAHEQVDAPVPIRRMAQIELAAQIGREVDYALAPQFVAGGLDTRAADALALGIPVLASGRAAAGLRLAASLVCDSAEEMASRIVEIGRSRPPLAPVQAALHSARDHLRSRSATGEAKLLDAVAKATEPVIIDLGSADPDADCLALQSYLSTLRAFARHRSILLVLPPDLMPSVAPLLPLPVKPIARDALPSALQSIGGRVMLVDVFGAAPPAEGGFDRPYRLVRDLRWAPAPANANLDEATLAQTPFFHSDIDREPAAQELRRRWAHKNAAPLAAGTAPTRFVFVDDIAGAIDLAGIADKLRTRIVPLSDQAAFRAAAMLLLEPAGPAEIAWLAPAQGLNYRLLLQLCAVRELPLWAMLDAACFVSGPLPPRAAKEFDRACEQQLSLLLRRTG
jgi:hypothetical protein